MEDSKTVGRDWYDWDELETIANAQVEEEHQISLRMQLPEAEGYREAVELLERLKVEIADAPDIVIQGILHNAYMAIDRRLTLIGKELVRIPI